MGGILYFGICINWFSYLWYFAKAVAIAFALGTYLPLYRARLVWQIDKFAVVAGLAIGLIWIAFGFQDQSRTFAIDNSLASLPLSLWLGWVLVRLIGTIALVPVAEELFFRGYLLDRFAHNGGATRVMGLLLSTGLFAVMHVGLLTSRYITPLRYEAPAWETGAS